MISIESSFACYFGKKPKIIATLFLHTCQWEGRPKLFLLLKAANSNFFGKNSYSLQGRRPHVSQSSISLPLYSTS